MKRILSVLLCLVIMALIIVNIIHISNNQLLKLGNLEKKYCQGFMIPDDEKICDPDVLFEVLSLTAKTTSSNIVRSSIIDETGKRSYNIVKYVLIVNEESSYMNAFELQDGEMLTSAQTMDRYSHYYVSTQKTSQSEQTGLIKDNMLHTSLTIYPLCREFEYIKADGLYFVELSNTCDFDQFLQELQKNIATLCGEHIEINELYGSVQVFGVPYSDLSPYILLIVFMLILLMLFVLYYLFKGKRKIGVMKLMGISSTQIWRMFFGEAIMVYPLFGMLCTVLLIVLKKSISDVIEITYIIWIAYILLLAFLFVVFHFLSREIDINQALKGKNYTKGIIGIQVIVELICVFFVTYSGASLYSDINEVTRMKNMYQNWANAAEYGVFYPLYHGDEQTEKERFARDIIIGGELYKHLNADGALFVNATEYEKQYMKLNEEFVEAEYERSIKVNPNYLSLYPIYDEYGKRISVDEDESELILLVPEEYKEDELKILNYYASHQSSIRQIDEEYYHQRPEVPANQIIKIIWTCSGQKIFTFDSSVGLEAEGIRDPVVVVLTENNSYISQRIGILGNGNADPLKVRLTGSSKETYDALAITLKELGLVDNLKALVSINEQAESTLAIIKANILSTVQAIIALLVLIILLVCQSTAVIFDYKKKEYIVKQLFGLPWLQIFGKQYLLQTIPLVILSVIYSTFIGTASPVYSVFMATFILSVQTVAFYIYTEELLKKNRSNVLKGE